MSTQFNCFQSLHYSPKARIFSNGRGIFPRRFFVSASINKSHQPISSQSKLDILLDSVKWDDKGLAVAIAQHIDTGAVLMQGTGNLKKELEAIMPELKEMRKRKVERMNQFAEVN